MEPRLREPRSHGVALKRSRTHVEPRSRRAVLRRYVAALNACEKGSQWERTLKLLREMWQRGWRPTGPAARGH